MQQTINIDQVFGYREPARYGIRAFGAVKGAYAPELELARDIAMEASVALGTPVEILDMEGSTLMPLAVYADGSLQEIPKEA